jgi:hydroxyethylthiazole kinase-like uncharacterized protein yjeF
MQIFDPKELSKIYKPHPKSNGEDNGQVTIIGGSDLFHGAPLFALKTASRIVDMVFFASPEPSLEAVTNNLKASLSSFIWVPWNEVDTYIEKSDSILIGVGMKRYESENSPYKHKTELCDEECQKTRDITKRLLLRFSHKRWVIDAGSLQTMDVSWIPKGSIITPNMKEFSLLFNNDIKDLHDIYHVSEDEKEKMVSDMAKKYQCTVVLKGPDTIVASPNDCVLVKGGNAGMTKGGTGDTLAGLIAALLSKNEPFLSACAGVYVEKFAADKLYKRVGVYYNADDLVNEVPEVLSILTRDKI